MLFALMQINLLNLALAAIAIVFAVKWFQSREEQGQGDKDNLIALSAELTKRGLPLLGEGLNLLAQGRAGKARQAFAKVFVGNGNAAGDDLDARFAECVLSCIPKLMDNPIYRKELTRVFRDHIFIQESRRQDEGAENARNKTNIVGGGDPGIGGAGDR